MWEKEDRELIWGKATNLTWWGKFKVRAKWWDLTGTGAGIFFYQYEKFKSQRKQW